MERELARGEGPLREEWARLQALLGRADAAPGSVVDLREAVARAEEALCDRIRAGDADAGSFREAVLVHVRASLEENVRIGGRGA